jgi:murein DD-endopeptidase MepM/ murein hydrolase activator NlpD
VPRAIRHRVIATAAPAGAREAVEGAPARVGTAGPAVAPPVGAGRWVALRGPSNTSGHRRSLVALDGAVRVPQRFAVDWARLGDDGRLFRGTGASNDDWHGFGEPVLAARGGRVVRVVGDRPDHPPRQAAAARFDRVSATGNTVVIDEGDGRFAIYAHLRQGSLAVAEGQEVVAGTPLGAIGNSGHSLAPHLHFHVGTAAEPLAAEGLPFTLTGYRLVGRLDSFAAAVAGAAWQPDARRTARPVAGEMPLENMVIELTAPAAAP